MFVRMREIKDIKLLVDLTDREQSTSIERDFEISSVTGCFILPEIDVSHQ